MKANYYSECSRDTNSERIKEMIMRESRDLVALIKANECYLSPVQLTEVKNEAVKLILGKQIGGEQ